MGVQNACPEFMGVQNSLEFAPELAHFSTSPRLMTALRRWLIGIMVFQLAVASVSAERVIRVKDGDSIVVESAGNEVDVRVADIDAPELSQPYGEEAKSALEMLVGAHRVRLELVGGDMYRRIVANVYVNERDVAAELVGRGLAWVRRAYAPTSRLIGLEETARDARRGLWSDPSPVPPWIWRKMRKGPVSGRTGKGSPRVPTDCGSKNYCREMSSCEEAIAYLHHCGLNTLDGDSDGVPCESLCRYYR